MGWCGRIFYLVPKLCLGTRISPFFAFQYGLSINCAYGMGFEPQGLEIDVAELFAGL